MNESNPGYYLNAQLRALKPGEVVSSPGGKLLRKFDLGSIVGEVFSYVVKGKAVWWQLKEGGFVLHEEGKFDPLLSKNTSQGFEDQISKHVNSADWLSFLDGFNISFLGRVGKMVAIVVVLFLALKIFGRKR